MAHFCQEKTFVGNPHRQNCKVTAHFVRKYLVTDRGKTAFPKLNFMTQFTPSFVSLNWFVVNAKHFVNENTEIF